MVQCTLVPLVYPYSMELQYHYSTAGVHTALQLKTTAAQSSAINTVATIHINTVTCKHEL